MFSSSPALVASRLLLHLLLLHLLLLTIDLDLGLAVGAAMVVGRTKSALAIWAAARDGSVRRCGLAGAASLILGLHRGSHLGLRVDRLILRLDRRHVLVLREETRVLDLLRLGQSLRAGAAVPRLLLLLLVLAVKAGRHFSRASLLAWTGGRIELLLGGVGPLLLAGTAELSSGRAFGGSET